MSKEDEKRFLEKELGDLTFTDEFIEQSSKMGFTTVSDLVNAGWAQISRTKGFSSHWFSVLLKVFEENKMLHLLYNKTSK